LAGECKELTLSVTSGRVRLYGVSLKTEAGGVIYDSLGINGAYISVLSKFLRPEHWGDQLRHYQPQLVVINYGTNESVYAAFVDKVFEKELRETIKRAKAAVPEASILVMSPMDRGARGASGVIETVPAIEKLVAIEQKVAQEEGVAFFNTFAAMGGNGTMREWYEGTPRLVGADFIHPMPAGAKRIGEYLYRALLDGFNHYKSRKQGGVEVAVEAPKGPPAQN
jgi:lysophospholipase L1-like esterase